MSDRESGRPVTEDAADVALLRRLWFVNTGRLDINTGIVLS